MGRLNKEASYRMREFSWVVVEGLIINTGDISERNFLF
jgi:hypothetical protein